MRKQTENIFHDKFSLLNSQKYTEDIKWSSSSSSDYDENTSNNDRLYTLLRAQNRKRKRRRKVPKNVSNLDVTILDTSKNTESQSKSDIVRVKSPILVTKSISVPIPLSPILTSNKFPPKEFDNTSPILNKKVFIPKSPILTLRSASPKSAINVRKKLCYNHKSEDAPIPKIQSKSSSNSTKKIVTNNYKTQIKEEFIEDSDVKIIPTSESTSSKSENQSDSSLHAKFHLVGKVKHFFDSHFSSETTISQNISDTPTPDESSKNEDNIEILSCKTQSVASNIQSIKQEISIDSDSSSFLKRNKKVNYKKGGLAYRLNMLLKKQNAHVSLWQHERFLAGNSNFVIPKEEHVVFHIQTCYFKYGCYLMEAVDVKFEKYVIVVNNIYVKNNIKEDFILKLYEPFQVINVNKDFKIITNVCKFECVDFKNDLD